MSPKAQLKVAAGWGNNPNDASPTWVEIGPYVRAVHWHNSRQNLLQRSEVGEGTITLDNSTRLFDPTNVSSPYYPNIRPGTPVRVQTILPGGGSYLLARGVFRSFPQTWEGKKLAVVPAVFDDMFSIWARTPLVSYSQEVQDDNPQGYWRLGETSGNVVNPVVGVAGTYGPAVILGSTAGPLIGGLTSADFANPSVNSYADLGTDASLDVRTAFAIEGWFYYTGGDTGMLYASGGNAGANSSMIQLYVVLGSLHFNVIPNPTSGSVGIASAALSTGFHHVVAQHDPVSGFNFLHLDSVEVGRIPVGVPLVPSLHHPCIGNEYTGAGFSNNGYSDRIAQWAIYDTALSPARITAHYAATFDMFVAQATGTALGTLLDLVGWPAGGGNRTLDAGHTTMTPFVPTGFALDVMHQVAEDTEDGWFFMDRNGIPTFKQRYSAPTAIDALSDASGGQDYSELVLDFADDSLYTVARVTPGDGSGDQVAKGNTTAYGQRELQLQTFLVPSEANDRANAILLRYGQATLTPTQIQFTLGQNSTIEDWSVVPFQQADQITVTRTPPGGGSPITIAGRITGVTHDIRTDGVWVVTWDMIWSKWTNATDFWVLDTSQLDTGTILGY